MPPHQRLGVAQRVGQRWHSHRIADVAQRHTDVTQQASPLSSLDRAMTKALPEPLLIKREQRDERRAGADRSARPELQRLAAAAQAAAAAQPRPRPAGPCANLLT